MFFLQLKCLKSEDITQLSPWPSNETVSSIATKVEERPEAQAVTLASHRFINQSVGSTNTITSAAATISSR